MNALADVERHVGYELEILAINGPHLHAHLLCRVQAAQGAARFCERQHQMHEAQGYARRGVPCSPHCTLYPAGSGG